MQIPFNDLKANYASIKEEVLKEIHSVLDNTEYILGKKVQNFENHFAEAHDVKHCIALSSGTDANHLASWVHGIERGDEIIIPANTFIATAWGATLCGAIPVFVDCDAESYTINPELVEQAITPNTKAIVAVHLYGQPANLDPLKKIAERHGLLLIEDAAQAHLAEYKGKKVGGLADIAAFSFYPGKNLGAYGEGGAITTNNDALDLKCRMMRDHGASQKYHHETFGHNYRMEGIQGAVLGVKLKYLDEWTKKRRAVAEKYNEMLSGIEEIILPAEMNYSKHVYHLYVIQVPNRNELQKKLTEKGISTGLHYPIPLPLQKCFSHLGYEKGSFPEAEKLAENSLSLPIFPEMTEDQISYVANHVRSFCKTKVFN